MESRDEMVMLSEGGRHAKSGSNLSGAIGSPGKTAGHRSCLSPGAAPYPRERTEAVEESARRNVCADMRPVGSSSSGERHRTDHPHKDGGSSSDTESDFYEEIDVSCTPESMDYPTAKGRIQSAAGFFSPTVMFSSMTLTACKRPKKCQLAPRAH